MNLGLQLSKLREEFPGLDPAFIDSTLHYQENRDNIIAKMKEFEKGYE